MFVVMLSLGVLHVKICIVISNCSIDNYFVHAVVHRSCALSRSDCVFVCTEQAFGCQKPMCVALRYDG